MASGMARLAGAANPPQTLPWRRPAPCLALKLSVRAGCTFDARMHRGSASGAAATGGAKPVLAAAAAAGDGSTAAAAVEPSPTASNSPRICVVGAGVIGLTAALRIKQALPAATVTVVAEQFEDLTSHGAGGLWKPFTLGDTPPELSNRWGQQTFQHYMQLYQSRHAPAAGTILTSAYQLFREPVPDPAWAGVVPHFRHLAPAELAAYDPEGTHSHGWFYTTIITEGRLYLRWLRGQLEGLGVRLEQRRLGSIEELAAECDVVVNCTGLGARELARDGSVYPVRGHVLRLRAPWVRHYTNCEYPGEGDCYIIPNTETVVVGGTVQKGDSDTQPREAERAAILDRACRVLPSLAAAEVVAEWVGLRPGRPSVRLELERVPVGSSSSKSRQGGGQQNGQQQQEETQRQQQQRSLPVVHNYGHGGAGLTLAWGCAGDAAELVQRAIAERGGSIN